MQRLSDEEFQALANREIAKNRWNRRFHIAMAELKEVPSWIGSGVLWLKDSDKRQRRQQSRKDFVREELSYLHESMMALGPPKRYLHPVKLCRQIGAEIAAERAEERAKKAERFKQ